MMPHLGKAFWAEKAASIGYLRQGCAWVSGEPLSREVINGIGAEVDLCLSDILVGMEAIWLGEASIYLPRVTPPFSNLLCRSQ